MGAIAFLLLVILGFILAVVGSIVTIVDAFRVSLVWGLVAWFIPFGMLVYWVKYWGRKWAKNGFLISLSSLGALLLSVPFLGGFLAQQSGGLGTAPEESLSSEGVPIESIPIPVPGDEAATEEEFAEPLVPVAPQLSPIARADLIQSTDPNERLQQINSSRSNPFAVVPIPPPPQVIAPPAPPAPTAAAPPAGTATSPVGAARPGVPGAGSPVAVAPGSAPGATPGAPGTGQPATPPPLAPLPALPQPTLAEAVQVSGVMTIGSENFAVVQTSAGSQYVRVGQRVSNGRVLIKRIDLRGSEPMVVLEENGIEVSRPVGSPVQASS
jgi:hypothetical protein